MIACLGWGSLIWDPRDLPLKGPWQADGPLLNVEFLRCSNDGRVTLVLHESAKAIPGLWNIIPVETLEVAKHRLAMREKITARPWDIHHWSLGSPGAKNIEGLPEWAASKGVTHVIWTGLPPKWNGEEGRVPKESDVINYLDGLSGATRDRAEKYVRKAPVQVATAIREIIEQKLGWTTNSG